VVDVVGEHRYTLRDELREHRAIST
jgi:hypothetical protein